MSRSCNIRFFERLLITEVSSVEVRDLYCPKPGVPTAHRSVMVEKHMNYRDSIVRDPEICNGQPIPKGTRVALRTVPASMAAGDDVDRILKPFPSLTREAIAAACFWYVWLIQVERL
jgi:uncharacterized protein (DUF433 family)